MNIDKRNTDSIRSLLEDLKNRGVHRQKNFSVNFGHVFYAKGACPDISSQCMVTPEFSDFIVSACRLTTDMGFRQTMYPSRVYTSCGAVTGSSAVIEPDGSVRFCWETVGDEAKKVGILTDKGIEYNNTALKWLGWTPFAEACNSCDLLPICLRGCPLRTVYQREAEELGKTPCCAWKYNLARMLPLTKRAKEQGLLVERKKTDCAPESSLPIDMPAGSVLPGI